MRGNKMDNQTFADHIGILAKAEADDNYVALRSTLRTFTLDEVKTIQNIVTGLKAEVDQWARLAS
jgi:hypothetical protein